MIARRIMALLCLPAAFISGFAALTVSRGQTVPMVAETGARFDGTAIGKIMRRLAEPAPSGTDAKPRVFDASDDLMLKLAIASEPLNHPAHKAYAAALRSQGDARYVPFVAAITAARPRTPSFIAMSLEQAALRGDLPEAFRLLNRMTLVRPNLAREFTPALLSEMEAAPASLELAANLEVAPAWSPIFLGMAADRPKLLPMIARARIQADGKLVSNPAVDAKLVKRLASLNDYDTAWQIYKIGHPDAVLGGFQFMSENEPFEWQLQENGNQSVSLGRDNSIEIDMLNGGGWAARQTVKLDQGKWRLRADLDRTGSGTQEIVISAQCATGGEEIEIARLGPRAEKLDARLFVNGGCPYQTIEISTERSFGLMATVVTLSDLEITR
ncbi:hypothetical protein HME9302_02611 [Alteripontixanthobacter maritimus]|uniref:Uncharacterized protein n=1 Tax=Alteripontixanthobacter maritimus TaxID=2161824 RepID=A0A369QEQ8_9SPHN|nr:hypothetical protein [Alteripontixanthobacter maritimus]RDC61389.1 hypothetical protein HME9302_02611 [Alteripontixanthobacter maritimus]